MNNSLIIARRDEEPAVVVGNEDQSATHNLQAARDLYYYFVANMVMVLLFGNIPPPLNVRHLLDYSPPPTTLLPLSTRGAGALQHDVPADVTTPPPGVTLNGDQRRFALYCGAWLAFLGVYIAMCSFLLDYVQLKTDSQLEEHLGFTIMSIAGFLMTLLTSWIVVYTQNDLEGFMKDHFSPVYDVILKFLFWFSFFLTPLSILLLLFIPKAFNSVGYLIVFVLFVTILAFHFRNLKRLLGVGAEDTNWGDLEMV